MKLVRESSSSWTHIVWASFTWASLLAWAEFSVLAEEARAALREMAAALKATLDALVKEARETQDQTLFARPAAQAQQEAALGLLHRRLTEALTAVALQAGGGSKDHPAVREFLPDLLAGITGASAFDRPRLVREAADRLERLAVDFAAKGALAAGLRDAASGAEAAIGRNVAAWSAWTGERSEEVVAKRRVRLELERVHGLLRARFPGQRGFVESFFPKYDREDGKADAPAEAPPAETATTPTSPA